MDIKCPNCMSKFKAVDVVIGEILDCPDCGINLKVKNVERGIEVDITLEEEEDWGE